MASEILGFSVSLVGPGRTGKAFARSWRAAGGRLSEVIARDSAEGREAVEEIGGGIPRGLTDPHSDCDILFLTVPDDAIAPAARALAGRLHCRAAFHASGALAAGAMDALRPSAAALGSLHPLRVFTGAPGETWRGALVAIEGDADAVGIAGEVVQAVEGRSHRISSEAKPLYHAAATLAAGGTVALVSLAAAAWAEAGIEQEEARTALAGLAEAAAAAAASRSRNFEQAFTGPVARRDMGTLTAHRNALAGRGDILELYALLARETLRRTPGRGREEDILALLGAGGGDGKR